MSIDDFAILGYHYALKGGRLPAFVDEIDLYAFNAGISNANIRHGLKVATIGWLTSMYVESKQRNSFKTLTVVGVI